MIRLGVRLATAGGRGALAGLALTAIAVAIGTAVLLFALAFVPAVVDRDGRSAWRDFLVEGTGGTLVLVQQDRFEGRVITRVHVAAVPERGAVALPPGLDALPAPGTAVVSPALAALVGARPQDELGDRFGPIVGEIPGSALASPDELAAVVGAEPDILRALGGLEVEAFATTPAPLDLPPIGALIVILAAVGALAPVAVFVATATRMSAARRELRLAALRLVGATPTQIARLAAVEALVATILGTVGGLLLFVAARPLVARIPLDGATWWPDSIVPPPLWAGALFVVIQLVGAGAALVSMRRLTITPLGVQRRAAQPRPTTIRVVPLIAAVVALLVAVHVYRSDASSQVALAASGLAFGAVVVGIALAGPWLTALVGQALGRLATGASALLAARRLDDQPHASFGAIAGVTMAVFVATAFFTFEAYATDQAGESGDPLLRDGSVVAFVAAPAATTRGLAERISTLDGVTGVVEIREVTLVDGDEVEAWGWVASCPALVSTLGLDGAECARSGVSVTGTGVDPGRLAIHPAATDIAAPVHLTIEPGDTRPLLAGEDELGGHLPQVLVDPSAIGAAADALPVTRLYAATDSSPNAAERVRTAVVAAVPTAMVQLAEERVAGNETYAEIGRIVALGLVGTLALAGSSLAVAVTTGTLERRRQFVFLRSSGMPASALRWTILLQAGAPLVVVAAFSAALGVLVGTTVLTSGGAERVPLPGLSMLATLGLSLAIAMAIVALTLPPLERMTRPAALRHE